MLFLDSVDALLGRKGMEALLEISGCAHKGLLKQQTLALNGMAVDFGFVAALVDDIVEFALNDPVAGAL